MKKMNAMKNILDVLSAFESHLLSHDCSPHTIHGYLGNLRQFADWFEQTNGAAFSLDAVTPTDIREYKQYLQTIRQQRANTVNRHLAAISALMKWAKNTGQLPSDPSDGIRLVKQTPTPPRWLDKKQQYALQRAIERDLAVATLRYPKRWLTRRRDASLVQFLFNTGLRLSETLALRLADIQISERRGSVLVRHGKGDKQRSVPLNVNARQAVQEWLAVRPPGECDFVWIAVEDGGGALSGRAVQRILKRYAQDAGLEDLTPHIARHTFAKNLVNSGVGLEKVASLLGHTSLNTTRIYIAPDQNDLEQAVSKLEKN